MRLFFFFFRRKTRRSEIAGEEDEVHRLKCLSLTPKTRGRVLVMSGEDQSNVFFIYWLNLECAKKKKSTFSICLYSSSFTFSLWMTDCRFHFVTSLKRMWTQGIKRGLPTELFNYTCAGSAWDGLSRRVSPARQICISFTTVLLA